MRILPSKRLMCAALLAGFCVAALFDKVICPGRVSKTQGGPAAVPAASDGSQGSGRRDPTPPALATTSAR